LDVAFDAQIAHWKTSLFQVGHERGKAQVGEFGSIGIDFGD